VGITDRRSQGDIIVSQKHCWVILFSFAVHFILTGQAEKKYKIMLCSWNVRHPPLFVSFISHRPSSVYSNYDYIWESRRLHTDVCSRERLVFFYIVGRFLGWYCEAETRNYSSALKIAVQNWAVWGSIGHYWAPRA
jgi:hypothetical protein